MPRIFVFALVAGLADAAFAEGVARTPQTIYVGVYVNQINSLSLKANQFEVDFTIWFRGHADDFNPLDTFDVMDGQSEYVSGKTTLKVGGSNYASCRVIAKITKFLSVAAKNWTTLAGGSAPAEWLQGGSAAPDPRHVDSEPMAEIQRGSVKVELVDGRP